MSLPIRRVAEETDVDSAFLETSRQQGVTAGLDSYVVEQDATEELVVPVIQEQAVVEKKLHVTGYVRVRKLVHEVEEIVREALASDTVDIERVPKDILVESPIPIRVEDNVTIIPILEEEVVVTKRLRLKEEVRISRRHTSKDFTGQVILRSEELVVERLNGQTPDSSLTRVQDRKETNG